MDNACRIFFGLFSLILQVISVVKSKEENWNACIFRYSDKNLVVFKNEQQLFSPNIILSYNESVTFRCSDISTQILIGSNHLMCGEKDWYEKFPRCEVLTPGDPLQAPVIEYTVENGDYYIANNGSLVVSENSNLVLVCWWFRKHGDNIWKWTTFSDQRRNATKELILNARYEVRLDTIKIRQRGVYSCVNPNGQAHDIEVRVIRGDNELATTNIPEKDINHCDCDCGIDDDGKSTSGDNEHSVHFDPTPTEESKYTTCDFELGDSNLLAYQNGQLLTRDAKLSPNDKLVFRCADISLHLLIGTNYLVCGENGWQGKIPRCEVLAHRNSEKAPVVTYKILNGEHYIAPNGSLLISEDASVFLDCWWFRNRYGEASWTWNTKSILDVPHVTASWTGMGNYELRLNKFQKGHEGLYSCSNPKGQEHGIDIRMIQKEISTETLMITSFAPATTTSKRITTTTSRYVTKNEKITSTTESSSDECPAMSFEDLTIHENGVELTREKFSFPSSTVLVFRCKNFLTHKLLGVTKIQCVKGRWSHSWPTCRTIFANNWNSTPPVSVSSDGSVIQLDNGDYLLSKGARVYFQCFFTQAQPEMYINNILVKKEIFQNEGQTPADEYWYVYAGEQYVAREFTFKCYIPRLSKEEKLSNSITVRIGGHCLLTNVEKEALKKRFPDVEILPSSLRPLYAEGDVVNFGCKTRSTNTSFIPEGMRCVHDIWELQSRKPVRCS